jgi:uncharacterized metal-binding protein
MANDTANQVAAASGRAAAGFDFAASGRRVIEIETHGLTAIAARIDGAFSDACRLLLAGTGRVVCTGMGKSGHIARKIAATLASTGTPGFYMHPGLRARQAPFDQLADGFGIHWGFWRQARKLNASV